MADTADAAEAVPPAETIEVPEQAEQEVAEQEENEENVDNVENEVPKEDPPPVVPACPTLCHLYGEGAFPAKELVPSVPMSPFVASCWPEKSPKDLLQQNWKPEAPEDAEATIAAFDPASAEYTVLPTRLARSKALQDINRLKIAVRDAEDNLQAIRKAKGMDEDKEALQAKIDEQKAQFDEAQSAFTELKASFQDDPQALTQWMNALFSTLDLGITTFAVSGSLLPTDVKKAFSERHGEECTEGIENLLVAFKKRCVLERGPESAPRLLFRLSPNMFRGPVTDETITAAISRLMEASGIDPEGETPGSLDIVELCWWDEELADPVSTLRQLSAMCKDETATDEETGEVTVTVPKKICALGVHGMSAKGIEAAVAAGVNLAFVRMPFGFHNRSAADAAAAVCGKYGIPVIGDECTLFGLMDRYFVDMPAPSPLEQNLPVTSMPHAMAAAKEMGGWEALQKALKAVETVAKKYSVEMQAVALRWCIDQGVTPVLPVGWRHTAEAFGKRGAPACAVPDTLLFQRTSFLSSEDIEALNAVAV